MREVMWVAVVAILLGGAGKVFSQDDGAKEVLEKYIKERTKIETIEPEVVKKFLPNWRFFKVEIKLGRYPMKRVFAVNKDNEISSLMLRPYPGGKGEDVVLFPELVVEEGVKLKGQEDVEEFASLLSKLVHRWDPRRVGEPEVEEGEEENEWVIYPLGKRMRHMAYVLRLDDEGKVEEMEMKRFGRMPRPPRRPRVPRPPRRLP